MSEVEHDQGAALADTGDSATEAPALSEVEQIASDLGWRSKEQFEGPEGAWRPAGEFLRRIPNTKDMKREIKGLKDTVDRMGRASTAIIEKSLREQAEAINARFAAAEKEGDVRGAVKAAEDMRALEAEAAATRTSTGDVEADFARDNPWYGKDEEATTYAIAVSSREGKKGASIEDQLATVQAAVRKRFPELFTSETKGDPKPPAAVSTPSRGMSPRAKTFATMPPEAQRAAESMAEQAHSRFGKDKDEFKKDYAATYWGGQAA